MATSIAKVNYTAEQTAAIIADYKAGMAPAAIAEKVGRNVRSIIAKLSREGVYVKATEAKKEKGTDKGELVTKIGNFVNMADNDLASLEKANRQALIAILAKVSA